MFGGWPCVFFDFRFDRRYLSDLLLATLVPQFDKTPKNVIMPYRQTGCGNRRPPAKQCFRNNQRGYPPAVTETRAYACLGRQDTYFATGNSGDTRRMASPRDRIGGNYTRQSPILLQLPEKNWARGRR